MQMNINTCTAETLIRMQTWGVAHAEQRTPAGAGGTVGAEASGQGWHGLG